MASELTCLTCEMVYGVGTTLVQEMGPCPDRMPGCCVMHYQYRCPRCGTVADLAEAIARRGRDDEGSKSDG